MQGSDKEVQSICNCLLDLNNNSVVPFTTTKETIGPPKSVIEHNLGQQQQQKKQYPIIATKVLYECREDCHVVKDTARVERRHVPLPTDKPVEMKSGSWLTNRYVVNDYIILSNIGKGAHAEVRLCKHKRTNEIYAAKIMNKKLLCEKFVDIRDSFFITKILNRPKVGRFQNIVEFDPRWVDFKKLLNLTKVRVLADLHGLGNQGLGTGLVVR